MKIPWMITALDVRKSPLGGTDVACIFDVYEVEEFPEDFTFSILAKYIPEPRDDISKDLLLQILLEDGLAVYENYIEGQRPTYQEWLNGTSSIMNVRMTIPLDRPREYTLALGTVLSDELHVLAEERIRVVKKGDWHERG